MIVSDATTWSFLSCSTGRLYESDSNDPTPVHCHSVPGHNVAISEPALPSLHVRSRDLEIAETSLRYTLFFRQKQES